MDIKKPFRNPKRWRGNTRKNNGNTSGKIGKTDGREDLPVYSRFPAEQGSTLHQQVFGLKHAAKLRHCYACEFIGNVKFLSHRFSQILFST